MQIAGDFLPYKELEVCCNSHDICYDTCSVTWHYRREKCDIFFKKCLANICASKHRTGTLLCYLSRIWPFKPSSDWCETSALDLRNQRRCLRSLLLQKIHISYISSSQECNTTVEIMYRFVESFGKNAYDDAQKQACICVKESIFKNFAFYSAIFIVAILLTLIALHMCSEFSVFNKKFSLLQRKVMQ